MAFIESVDEREFFVEVRKGNIPYHSIIHKFGSIDDVGSTLTPVTTNGVYRTPTSPVALEIVSDSVDDTAAGTGARKVTIEGISNTNGDWSKETQTVTLNGTTAVAVPNSMLRVFRMYVAEAGSYANQTTPSHSSTITLRESGAGQGWAEIISFGTFGLGQSEIAAYTVPSGYTGYLLTKNISVESGKSANVLLFMRDNIDLTSPPHGVMRVKELDRNLSDRNNVVYRTPKLSLPEKTDVGFMANTGTGTADLSIEFEILLIENIN